ncbi:MAG: nucleotidyl transferase AbiEii/AbiGii toxin family protein [Malacoplasma sp.]
MFLINSDRLKEEIKKVKKEYSNLSIIYIKKDILIDIILPKIKQILEDEKRINHFEICGGTCLSKFYDLTNRLSEDIDITIYSDSKTRNKLIIKSLENKFENELSKYIEHGTQWCQGKKFSSFKLLIENEVFSLDFMTEVGSRENNKKTLLPMSNLYQKIYREEVKEFKFPCSKLDKILIDKICAFENKSNSNDPVRIARHIYDVYKILNYMQEKKVLHFDSIIEKYKSKSKLEKGKITDNIFHTKMFNLDDMHKLSLESLIKQEVYTYKNDSTSTSDIILKYFKKIKTKYNKINTI